MEIHEKYMREAIEIAKTALGHTAPNPLVGCVVVKDGRVISKACHERYGEFHAERNALLRCMEDTTGADLYVTLEPCCHQGKTPPCTDIIIEKGIKRVFVGSMDPNPLVAGHGVEILRNHGIEVVTGILADECDRMNDIFMYYITTKLPYVAMKYAMTLDGKIAAYTGDSKWVTSDKTREHVMFLRKKYTSILVGINTVLQDNPMLNCRMENGVDPIRVVIDSTLRIPEESQIVQTARDIRTMIFYSEQNETAQLLEKKQILESKGIELYAVSGSEEHADHYSVDLKAVLTKLGELKIDSVLVEGGGEINGSLLETGMVNYIYAYIASKLIGGREAKSPVAGVGIPQMRDAVKLQDISIHQMDETDILLEGRVKKCLQD